MFAPVLAFTALEAGLRLVGFGKPATFLIPDEVPGFLRTNPDFAGLFLPGGFDLRPLNFRISRHKAPNTFRVVVLGESAAQGIPVPSFAFAPQLRAQLRHRYPGKEFEVVDTGIVAINSHAILQIAKEMARYEPDLFVVYAGNNEVVGPYGPGCAYLSQMPPLWVIRTSVWVRSTRTGQLVSSVIARVLQSASHKAEWGGMSMFVNNAVLADDPRLYTVYDNFADNLRGVVEAASGVGARTILCTVVANLKDCPPLLSRHGAWLSKPEIEAWRGPYGQGRLAWMLGDAGQARAQLTEAFRIDPEYADTSYMLGSLDLRAGDIAAARKHFVDALHWDTLRFRPDAPVNDVIRRIARESASKVLLLDAAMALGSDPSSDAPISGREILFEHVHFDWPGNYLLARMLARQAAVGLFGQDPGAEGWLDSEACASALAYTAHERLPMLLRMDALVRKPPFTNQITYVENEAAMARALDAATREMRSPESLSRAREVATQALSQDPENPSLAGILEGVDLDMGDLQGALELTLRIEKQIPRDYALVADQATVLMKLGRYPEAWRALERGASVGSDLPMLAPVLEDYWIRTRQYREGIAYLDKALSQRATDRRLRVVKAGLLRVSGDLAGAEGTLRTAFTEDPSNGEALEALVATLRDEGKTREAAKESLAAAPFQPRNQENSLRVSRDCEARGDQDGLIGSLEAAEQGGPVSATFELTLALKLYQARRMEEMMLHLAHAKRLATDEGNPGVLASIENLVSRMQMEWDVSTKSRN